MWGNKILIIWNFSLSDSTSLKNPAWWWVGKKLFLIYTKQASVKAPTIVKHGISSTFPHMFWWHGWDPVSHFGESSETEHSMWCQIFDRLSIKNEIFPAQWPYSRPGYDALLLSGPCYYSPLLACWRALTRGRWGIPNRPGVEGNLDRYRINPGETEL